MLMQRVKRSCVLLAAYLFLAGFAQADNLSDITSPQETPPSSPVLEPTTPDDPFSPSTPGNDDGAPLGCAATDGGTGSCDIEPDAGSVRSGVQPRSSLGNPINLMSGNKSQPEVDFAIPGAQLTFRRMYNSATADANIGLGQGWTHTYAVSLFDSGNGSREIIQSNGARLRFTPDGTDENGHPLMRGNRPNFGYVSFKDNRHQWHLPDGRTLTFNGSFLTEINWPDQQNLKLYYRFRRLHSVTDETGRVLRFDYHDGASAGLLNGYETSRFSKMPGQLDSLTLPDGSQIHYDYDNRRNLTRARFSDGTSREYHYEDQIYPNHLTGLTDRTGVRFASWSYDDYGRAISSEHADGVERVTLAYPHPKIVASGEVVQTIVTNSLGNKSQYTWQLPQGESHPQLLASSGSGCTTCPETGYEYIYDSQGRLLTSIKTGVGNAIGSGKIEYRYDELGRIIEIRRTDESGQDHLVERREYEKLSSNVLRRYQPSVNPDAEQLTEYERNERGLPVRIVRRGYTPWVALAGEPDYLPDTDEPIGYRQVERIYKFGYEDSRLSLIDGPRDDVEDIVKLNWDQRNRLISVKQPLGPTITFTEFDSLGRATLSEFGDTGASRISYNEQNQIAEIERNGFGVKYTYDAESRLVAFTDSDGHTTRVSLDEAGRVIERVDAFGRSEIVEFNSESKPVKQSIFAADSSLIRALEIAYDSHGRLEQRNVRKVNRHGEQGAWDTRYLRSDDGQITAQEELGTGARFDFTIDTLNNARTFSNPLGETTRYFFDDLGQETGLVDARGTTTRRYRDDFGGIVGVVSPDTGVERYERDGHGEVVRRVQEDTGSTIYLRDAAGRAIERIPQSGPVTRWMYDVASGRVSVAQHGDITERFTYQSALLIRHTREMDGLSFTTSYERDERGRIVYRTLPDGQQLHYQYYSDGVNAGTLSSISLDSGILSREIPIVDQVDLEPRDGETGWRAHNGIRTTITMAADQTVTEVNTTDVLSIELERSFAGTVLSKQDAGKIARYAYDQGRLIAADTVGGQYRYQYDAVGNRISRLEQHSDGAQIDQQYAFAIASTGQGAGNRLVSLSDQNTGEVESRTYNSGGTVQEGNGLSYRYDTERRPTQVSRDGQVIARYAYNAFGERVRKEIVRDAGGTQIRYALFDGPRLGAEADETGKIIAQYVYIDATRAVAKLEGKNIYAIHSDHLATPRRMTDTQGNVVWSAYIEPFGRARILLETVRLDLRLPGQWFDEETGTHYNYYRDYDPDQGRYMTSDPIGLSGGVNTYLYAFADPLSLIDPLGLRVILMDRDLDGVPIGTHMFIVIIPDKPEDFENVSFDIGFGRTLQLTDIGNGASSERGYVIGAQRVEVNGQFRLIAEGFNISDRTAANQYFDTRYQLYGGTRGTMGNGDFSATATQCSLPVDSSGAINDTASIVTLISNISNFNANEEVQNIPYPTGSQTVFGSSDGYVNSNSWALSALTSAGITPERFQNPLAADLLHANRIDPDYFTYNPDLENLTVENTDTDGDGDLDAQDYDDDGDGVPDVSDAWPIDASRS